MGQFYAITPFTLLDYPGEAACIAWFARCNLRCVYCHNPEMVQGSGNVDTDTLLEFLNKRQGLLSGVVLSGGEATLNPSLPQLTREIKNIGFKIKLDTNGTRPHILADLLKDHLLDYVALDYKCPASRTPSLIGTSKFADAVRQSLELLIESAKERTGFEVRTTFHADLMSEDDLSEIIEELDCRGYQGTYYIQNIEAYGKRTLGNIAKPSRSVASERLPQPKNFKLAFRNFKDQTGSTMSD